MKICAINKQILYSDGMRKMRKNWSGQNKKSWL